MFWDNEYESNERIWGERPSELAVAAFMDIDRRICGHFTYYSIKTSCLTALTQILPSSKLRKALTLKSSRITSAKTA